MSKITQDFREEKLRKRGMKMCFFGEGESLYL